MITAITIQNFKGIGNEPFRLPIKPLTLLFGPNSAGKSTILQAIHYAREVLNRHNLDAEGSEAGGDFVKLGGFRNFVHRREFHRRAVTIQFELDLRGTTWTFHRSRLGDHHDSDAFYSKLNEWSATARSANVAFSVKWSKGGLYVSDYSVSVDGVKLCALQMDPKIVGRHPVRVSELDFAHPIFAAFQELKGWPREEVLPVWEWLRNGQRELTADLPDALPNFQRRLDLCIANFDENGDVGDTNSTEHIELLIEDILSGIGKLLLRDLNQFRYLGPLRQIPPRGYTPPRYPDVRRWVSGLAAWDVLTTCDDADFIKAVSRCMHDDDQLATGYEVERRRYKLVDLDNDAESPAIEERVTLRTPATKLDVLPEEVGVGISQVLPIVVACLEPNLPTSAGHQSPDQCRQRYWGWTAIEQPELHLHPRMQCALGDVLINGALGHRTTTTNLVYRDNKGEVVPPPQWSLDDGEEVTEGNDEVTSKHEESFVPTPRCIIVETHSEHLILRILRRIRETAEGNLHDNIALTPTDVSVCYVNPESGESVPRTLRINERGEFIDRWPKGFFDERHEELFS